MQPKGKQYDMGTKEKLRERFQKLPSDFTFDEMQRLLEGYGYERSNKGRTNIQEWKQKTHYAAQTASWQYCQGVCHETGIG